MTPPPIHNVPAPRTLDPSAWQRSVQELNTQLSSLQRQVKALEARVAALEA